MDKLSDEEEMHEEELEREREKHLEGWFKQQGFIIYFPFVSIL